MLDPTIKNQLQRSTLSISINIAEGSGRMTNRDRKHFFIIARASLFESFALFDILHKTGVVSSDENSLIREQAETISKLLYVMIRNLS